MKALKKIGKLFLVTLIAVGLSGCVGLGALVTPVAMTLLKNMNQSQPVEGNKTFSQSELQGIIPALGDYTQTSLIGQNGKVWSGIFLPKNLDVNNGGTYDILVILNSNGSTAEDFASRKMHLLEMFPGARITGTKDISETIFSPIRKGRMSRDEMNNSDYGIARTSVIGDVHTVVIPPKNGIAEALSPLKHHSKKSHK